MKYWIQAARPRTLILGLCGPSFVALYGTQFPDFNWTSWGLFTFTLLALQIVSNFANDLGDGLKGSDNNRQGEERMLSSGKLSISQFKKAHHRHLHSSICHRGWFFVNIRFRLVRANHFIRHRVIGNCRSTNLYIRQKSLWLPRTWRYFCHVIFWLLRRCYPIIFMHGPMG